MRLFAPAIENTKQLIVPTVSIYEVFKRILQQRDEHTALLAISSMYQGKAVGWIRPLPYKLQSYHAPTNFPCPTVMILGNRRCSSNHLVDTRRRFHQD